VRPNNVDDASWIGSQRASSRLGVTIRVLYAIIDEGHLRARKRGRLIEVHAEDVEQYYRNIGIGGEPG
jgi:excisionase family DNA binding protein